MELEANEKRELEEAFHNYIEKVVTSFENSKEKGRKTEE
jgi:hypothetical protein